MTPHDTFRAEVNLGFWVELTPTPMPQAETLAAAKATTIVKKALEKAGITTFGVNVRAIKDTEGRCWARKGSEYVEVNWETLEPLVPPGRLARYEKLKETYDPCLDSLSQVEERLDKGQDLHRYLFIEQGAMGYWFVGWDDLTEAAAHYQVNYDPGEWVLHRVVDLDTALELPFEMSFTLAFLPAASETPSVPS